MSTSIIGSMLATAGVRGIDEVESIVASQFHWCAPPHTAWRVVDRGSIPTSGDESALADTRLQIIQSTCRSHGFSLDVFGLRIGDVIPNPLVVLVPTEILDAVLAPKGDR